MAMWLRTLATLLDQISVLSFSTFKPRVSQVPVKPALENPMSSFVFPESQVHTHTHMHIQINK